MAQRRSISDSIRQAAHGAAAPEPTRIAVPLDAPQERAGASRRPFKASTREGKKMIATPVDPAARRQLKILSAETGKPAEELQREALRDLFTKYGKPPIA